MTTIYTTTAAEYNLWSKLQTRSFNVIQLSKKEDIERFKLHKSYHLNSVPCHGFNNFGVGFYKIIDMGVMHHLDDSESFYGLANYKVNADEEFDPNFKVDMYLNPLRYFKSVGRPDYAIEDLLGATIEIIDSSFIPPDTRNEKRPRLHYSWRIVEYPVANDNIPDNCLLDNDDDLLNALYGD